MKPARAQRKRAVPADWDDIHRRLGQVRHAIERLSVPDRESEEKTLRERAADLAKAASRAAPAASALLSAHDIEALVFQAGGERYAFETVHVAQVYPMTRITGIPGVPGFVVGVMAVQGETLSVIDLRSLLDLPLSNLAEPAAIIVLKSAEMEFGVLAEDILGVERYPVESLEQGLPALADTHRTYLKGVSPDRTAILDAAQLLADSRLVVEIN